VGGRLLKSWPELQICITQLGREGSPPPGVPLLQAKLSRNSNQIARGRIRRFESYMPSHAVVSNSKWSAQKSSHLGVVHRRGIASRELGSHEHPQGGR
jgi:hypothetical protein